MAIPSPPSPRNIARYEILGELGKGAMGVVYKARDPNIGRLVALKTMRLDVHGMEASEMLLRFKNEARAAGVLNHSNIVTIYDAGEFEGLFYIAMEFIEGVTLQRVLNEQSILPVEQVLDLSRQICAGLDYAHSHRIIHRDVKPANIMIEHDGRVKIMDFGIAKAEGAQLTTAGQVLGTPNYMSPEQVKGRPLDGRTDLWSFGVILYEMVTGEKPFTGQNVTTIIYKIVNENPIAPKELDSSIHPGLSAVIQRALAKHPDQRYQKGADLVHHLINYKSIGVDTASLPADAGAAHVPAPPAPAAPKAQPAAAPPAAPKPAPPEVKTVPGAPGPAAPKAQPAAAVPAKPAAPVPAKPAAVAEPAVAPAKPAAAPAVPAAPKPSAPPAASAKPGAPPPADADLTLVAGSHEPPQVASAAASKAVMPKLTTNQWLMVTAGALAVVLVVVALGVYSSERSKPSAAANMTEPVAQAPATQAPQDGQPAPPTSPGEQVSGSPAEQPADPFKPPAKPRSKATTTPVAAASTPASTPAQPASAAPINGTLRMVSNPAGAKVEIDGWSEPSWLTPFNSPNLSTGQHKVVFSKVGYASETRMVEVTAGNQSVVSATLKAAAAPSHIEVTSDPTGAAIILDGKETGKQTPATLDVYKGEHAVVLRKLGYRDVAIAAKVAEGETAHVSQSLKSGSGGANPFGKLFGGSIPEGMGALQVKTKPKGATVKVNGEAAPKTTPLKIPVDPGKYNVAISLEGYATTSQTVTIEKGKTATVDVELTK